MPGRVSGTVVESARWTYNDGKDDVAEIALRSCHCVSGLGLVCEPLALFWQIGALHFGCLRMLQERRWAGVEACGERGGSQGNERMPGAEHAHQQAAEIIWRWKSALTKQPEHGSEKEKEKERRRPTFVSVADSPAAQKPGRGARAGDGTLGQVRDLPPNRDRRRDPEYDSSICDSNEPPSRRAASIHILLLPRVFLSLIASMQPPPRLGPHLRSAWPLPLYLIQQQQQYP